MMELPQNDARRQLDAEGTTRRRHCGGFVACIALLYAVATYSTAQLADPLGNELFFGRGTPIYEFNASYALLGGESSLSRNKLFREKTGRRNYFTFDISRPNIRHRVTVGNFPTKFSSFTLDKELFDAVRWSVTVPQARGSATGFLARLTNNSFDDRGKPIENRPIRSEGDWFMAGLRAEANLGAWYVKYGKLPEFVVPLPQIGVSFVNRFFTNYDLARTANPFRGVVATSPPTALYVRVRDGSPDESGTASVFRVRVLVDGETRFDFVGGREPPGVLMLPTSSRRSPDGDARIAEGNATFTYRFPLLSPQDVRSVEFVMDVGGDYIVELSADGENFERRLDARTGFGNRMGRRTERFVYGELTDETTFGIDLQTTLWGVAIEAERSWYSRTLQYPVFNAERRHTLAGAWFVDMNRRFGPLFWRGEYTNLDPFFDASNFVDDNDNNDPYLDAREASVPFAGSDKDDRDRDGIKDWNDDFLLFFTDPPAFERGLKRESIDFNNNGYPDNLEDDLLPNYRLDYDEGTNGFHTYFTLDIPAARGLTLIPGYYEKNVLTTGQHAQGFYNIVSYEPERIPEFGYVRARYTLRRSRDSIPDDYIDPQSRKVVRDDLSLGDYIGNIFTLIVDYDNVPALTIRTKFKYERNTLFNLRRQEVDAQLIHQIRYEYKVRDDLTIAPAFRSDRTIGYTSPFNRGAQTDSLRNAYLLTMTHRVAEELQLSGGLEYLTWRDFVEPRNHFNRRVGFLELVLQGQAFGQKIGLITTIDFVSQTFLRPIGGDRRSTNFAVELFLL